MTTFLKDPEAILDYSIDWTDFLETAETIFSSQWFTPTGITLDSNGHTDKVATAWLSDGTAGQSYELVNRITTDNVPARVDERTIIISIVNK